MQMFSKAWLCDYKSLIVTGTCEGNGACVEGWNIATCDWCGELDCSGAVGLACLL